MLPPASYTAALFERGHVSADLAMRRAPPVTRGAPPPLVAAALCDRAARASIPPAERAFSQSPVGNGNKSALCTVFFSMSSTAYGLRNGKLGVNESNPNGVAVPTPASMSTGQVVPAEIALSGEDDSARFARVVLPYLGDAYELARWLAGNRADAEDIVQEACLRAFRGILRFKEGNARAWVLTIVRNTAYTWLGRNRPSNLVVTDDLEAFERAESDRGSPPGSDVETPEAALIAKADAARVQTALAALSAPFRETLVLRDLQGFDYREIAAMTGVPVGTVMSRLARARRRLMASIVKDDDDAHV